MKINSEQLLLELTKMVKNHIHYAESLTRLTAEQLNYKTDALSWSALECIEHLNLVMNFYVPEIRKRIHESKHSKSPDFKGTYIGTKFAQSMLPKENMSRVKTFKKVNPIHSTLDKTDVIKRFNSHQSSLLDLLEQAKNSHLSKIKTSTLLPLLKLRLGNAFQLVVYHNERHIVQAEKVLSMNS